MEKIKQMKKQKIVNKIVEPNSQVLENNSNNIPKSIVWGWKNINQVASDIWSSVHCSLLSGDLIFAFKNTGFASNELIQIVITRNIHNRKDFAVGVVTSGYSMLLPHIPVEYLDTDLLNDMKGWKIKSDILKTYESIIKIIENEIISN